MSPDTVPFRETRSTLAKADGTGQVTFQPCGFRQTLHVELVTVTSANLTITVLRDNNVVDATAADPRPQVTSDSKYDLLQTQTLVITWTGATAGQPLVGSVVGTLETG